VQQPWWRDAAVCEGAAESAFGAGSAPAPNLTLSFDAAGANVCLIRLPLSVVSARARRHARGAARRRLRAHGQWRHGDALPEIGGPTVAR
jgi:hypothetical protein